MRETDEQLYARMKDGDRHAFAELYERREPGLFRYALHMSGSRVVAEEVTHDAFMGLIQPGSRFDAQRGSLEAYLYGTVRNLVRVARRSPTLQIVCEEAVDHDLLGSM